MKYYAVKYYKTYPDETKAVQTFFLFAKNVLDAEKIFCAVTGNNKKCIISIGRMEKWDC